MEVDGKIVFFNEAEAVSDLDANEPEELEINAIHGKKTAGKRAMDMEGLPVERIDHYMTEEELKDEFGKRDGNSFRIQSLKGTTSHLLR